MCVCVGDEKGLGFQIIEHERNETDFVGIRRREYKSDTFMFVYSVETIQSSNLTSLNGFGGWERGWVNNNNQYETNRSEGLWHIASK